MTEAEAETMLAQLRAHYREPVMRVSKYCGALRTWARLIAGKERVDADALQQVRINIEKSNLLARLIYDGEELRQYECPIHGGKWSGCVFDEPCPAGCMHGCNVTGWLEHEVAAGALLGLGWVFWISIALGEQLPGMPPVDVLRTMAKKWGEQT